MEIRGIIKRTDIELVDSDCTVADAVGKIVDQNVGSVIVKRKDPSEPYGIVTRQDVLFKVIANGLDLHKVRVSEIMSSPVFILNNAGL